MFDQAYNLNQESQRKSMKTAGIISATFSSAKNMILLEVVLKNKSQHTKIRTKKIKAQIISSSDDL